MPRRSTKSSVKPTKESKNRSNQDRWYRGTFAIGHPEGLHTRPAAQFVKLAQHYPAQIEVRKGKYRVDGKSILNLLALGAKKGTQVTILAKGTKAKEAIATLGRFIVNKI